MACAEASARRFPTSLSPVSIAREYCIAARCHLSASLYSAPISLNVAGSGLDCRAGVARLRGVVLRVFDMYGLPGGEDGRGAMRTPCSQPEAGESLSGYMSHGPAEVRAPGPPAACHCIRLRWPAAGPVQLHAPGSGAAFELRCRYCGFAPRPVTTACEPCYQPPRAAPHDPGHIQVVLAPVTVHISAVAGRDLPLDLRAGGSRNRPYHRAATSAYGPV